MRISAIASYIPLTLADLTVVIGFTAAVSGAWMTFGAGPTLLLSGLALIWVGGVLYRAQEPS